MKQALFAFFSLATFFVSTTSYAQGWKWERHITSSPIAVTTETYLVRADASGNVYSGGTMNGYSTLPAGIILHWGSHDLVDSTACPQAFITKTDAAGNAQWIVGSQHAYAWISDIAPDNNGNVYVLGSYNNDSANFRFGACGLHYTAAPFSVNVVSFIAKVDISGNVLWARNIGYTISTAQGYGNVHVSSAGYIYVSTIFIGASLTIGTTTLTNLDASAISPDILLIKYDSTGSVLWAKSCGSDKTDRVIWSDMTSSGEVYIVGDYLASSITFGSTTLTNTSGNGNFIAKFDTNGDALWAKSSDTFAEMNSVSVDTSGNADVAGTFMSDTIQFGGQQLFNSSPGQTDVFLVKYDSNGITNWARSAGGSAADAGFSVAADACGNVWMTGNMGFGFSVPGGYAIYFGTDSLIAPAPGIGSSVNEPLFVAQYDGSGSYIRGMVLSGGGDDAADIAIDNNGNFYISGDWIDNSFVFGQDTITIDSFEEFLFVAKYEYDTIGCITPSDTTSGIQNTSRQSYIQLYPNPAQAECAILRDVVFPTGSKAELYDITGRLIKTYSLRGNTTILSLSGVSPGLYECKINAGESVVTKRLVVMK